MQTAYAEIANLHTGGNAGVGRVDRSGRRIIGAAIITAGPLRPQDARNWEVDDETLAHVVTLGSAESNGVKARFTHGSSDDALGKYLGRWTRFRREGATVRADLQLSPTAFKTPTGDYGTYVLDLAENDPGAFGCSIAATLDMKSMLAKQKNGRLPMRLRTLMAVDVVDDPAATRGLFCVRREPGLAPKAVPWLLSQLGADDGVRLAVDEQQAVTLRWPHDVPQAEREAIEAIEAARLAADRGWLTSGLRSNEK